MLLARVLILSAAVAAVIAGINVARGGSAERRALGRHAYVCPMHAQVASATAGECPICRMALVRPADVVVDLQRNVGVVQSRLTAREIVAPAWRDGARGVNALLYDDEIAMLERGQVAEFFAAPDGEPPHPNPPNPLPASRGEGTGSLRMTDDPPRRWDGATSIVRFEAPRKQAAHVGWIRLTSPTRALLTVPRGAVRPSAAGPYVLIASPDLKTVTRRPVQVGRGVAGQAAVVAGARAGERIVATDSFFVDAEERRGRALR
jgi:hypothetical protein